MKRKEKEFIADLCAVMEKYQACIVDSDDYDSEDRHVGTNFSVVSYASDGDMDLTIRDIQEALEKRRA